LISVRNLKAAEKAAGKDKPMARKPNYNFEKRQKELAKKAKKEEKNKRKQDDKIQEYPDDNPSSETP
jgi:predicted RNA-binding protein with RPS1 domain